MQATLRSLAGKVRIDVEYPARKPWDEQDEWQQNANSYRCTLRYKGRRYSFDFWQGVGISGDPTVEGCLECLLSDASSAGQSFEDFCDEFGYDHDSRKAESTWKAVEVVARRMKQLLGDDYEAFMSADR